MQRSWQLAAVIVFLFSGAIIGAAEEQAYDDGSMTVGENAEEQLLGVGDIDINNARYELLNNDPLSAQIIEKTCRTKDALASLGAESLVAAFNVLLDDPDLYKRVDLTGYKLQPYVISYVNNAVKGYAGSKERTLNNIRLTNKTILTNIYPFTFAVEAGVGQSRTGYGSVKTDQGMTRLAHERYAPKNDDEDIEVYTASGPTRPYVTIAEITYLAKDFDRGRDDRDDDASDEFKALKFKAKDVGADAMLVTLRNQRSVRRKIIVITAIKFTDGKGRALHLQSSPAAQIADFDLWISSQLLSGFQDETVSPRDISEDLHEKCVLAYGKSGSIDRILFSTSGRYLAVVLSNITCGDPEQVWTIDLKTGKAALITDKLIEKMISIKVYNVNWEGGDTLVVETKRDELKDQSQYRHEICRATMGDPVTIVKSPAGARSDDRSINSPSGKYGISEEGDVAELRTNRTLFNVGRCALPDGPQIQWTSDEKYFVYPRNIWHGKIYLYAYAVDGKGKAIEIADGGWSLERYAVDPKGHRLIYIPDEFDKKNRLEMFDLDTQETVKTLVYPGGYARTLAWSGNSEIALVSSDGDPVNGGKRDKIVVFTCP